MGKFKDIITSVRVGAPVKNLGRADETVIRYKDKYISVLENPDGDIVSIGWFKSLSMTHEVVRDFWLATPPQRESE